MFETTKDYKSLLRSWFSTCVRLFILIILSLILLLMYRIFSIGLHEAFGVESMKTLYVAAGAGFLSIIPISLLLLLFDVLDGRGKAPKRKR